MNSEFIKGGETGDKMIKFGGVGVTDVEIVHDKSEGGGVGVMAKTHGGGGFGKAMLEGTGGR